MLIKKASENPARPVEISEWNDGVAAYIKNFNLVEQLEFDLLLDRYRDKTATAAERAGAIARAAITALVDASGAPLLDESQLAELTSDVSPLPFYRIEKLGACPNKTGYGPDYYKEAEKGADDARS